MHPQRRVTKHQPAYVEVKVSCPPCRLDISTRRELSPFKPVYMCEQHREMFAKWFGREAVVKTAPSLAPNKKGRRKIVLKLKGVWTK